MGFIIFVVVSTFLGFCGLADSAVQPAQAYRAAGRSKPLWVLIELVGMLSLVGGAVTWAIYSYGGTRRAVVKAGGYHRPKVGGNGPNEMRDRRTARYVGEEFRAQQLWAQTNTPQRCSGNCDNGSIPCRACNYGWIQDQNGATVAHNACSGTGRLRCAMCNGTGVR